MTIPQAKADREPVARKPAAAKPRPQPAERRAGGAMPAMLPPRAAASAARERLTAGSAEDEEPRAEARQRARPAAKAAPAPPAPPAEPEGPPPDPELKKAVTMAMLKFGDLSASDVSSAEARGLEDAVAAELGRRAEASALDLERLVKLVRAEWEVCARSLGWLRGRVASASGRVRDVCAWLRCSDRAGSAARARTRALRRSARAHPRASALLHPCSAFGCAPRRGRAQLQAESEDKEKGKRAHGKLARVKLCNSLRKLARAPPRAPLALGREDGLPAWWQPNVHDIALVRGSVQHGFNCYDAIFADASLFPSLPEADMVPSKPLQEALFKRIRKLLERPTAPKASAISRAGGAAGRNGGLARPGLAASRAPGSQPRAPTASAPRAPGGAQPRPVAAGSQPAAGGSAAPAPPKKQLAKEWAGGAGANGSAGGPAAGGSAVRLPSRPTPPPAATVLGAKRPSEPSGSAEQLPFKKQFHAR